MKDASTQISILFAILYQHWYGFPALMKSFSGHYICVKLFPTWHVFVVHFVLRRMYITGSYACFHWNV